MIRERLRREDGIIGLARKRKVHLRCSLTQQFRRFDIGSDQVVRFRCHLLVQEIERAGYLEACRVGWFGMCQSLLKEAAEESIVYCQASPWFCT